MVEVHCYSGIIGRGPELSVEPCISETRSHERIEVYASDESDAIMRIIQKYRRVESRYTPSRTSRDFPTDEIRVYELQRV